MPSEAYLGWAGLAHMGPYGPGGPRRAQGPKYPLFGPKWVIFGVKNDPILDPIFDPISALYSRVLGSKMDPILDPFLGQKWSKKGVHFGPPF